jgi:hypothetical protein
MKRILYIALIALCLVLASNRQASAWSKFNFGVGLNIGFEGGGNSVLFGMFKGAPTPGYGDGGGYPSFPGGPNAMPGGHASNNLESNFQAAGYPLPGQGAPMMMPTPAPMPQVAPMPDMRQMPRAEAQPVGYFTYPTYPGYPSYPQYFWYYGTWYGY